MTTTKEALERETVCGNCATGLYQTADPNNIHWYHKGTGDVRCPTRFAKPVSAPSVAPEVDQHDPICCAKYMRGESVPEGAHECGDIPWCRRCAWCVNDANAAAPAATVAPQQSDESGWLLEKIQEGNVHYIAADYMLQWTDDPNKALRLARREDAEALCTIVEDCEKIAEHGWPAPASPAALRDEADTTNQVFATAEEFLDAYNAAATANLLNEIDKTVRQLLRPNRTATDIEFAVDYIVSRIVALRRSLPPANTPPSTLAKAAAEEIAKERARQVAVEGWSAEHDDEHEDGELARAANCYRRIGNGSLREFLPDADQSDAQVPTAWPWEEKWWKPKTRLRNLIRAGALYQAEIERLIRTRDRVTEEAQHLIDKTG